MLNVIMLNAILMSLANNLNMLSVVMLHVVAPSQKVAKAREGDIFMVQNGQWFHKKLFKWKYVLTSFENTQPRAYIKRH
jgi:hypothetical protein